MPAEVMTTPAEEAPSGLRGDGVTRTVPAGPGEKVGVTDIQAFRLRKTRDDLSINHLAGEDIHFLFFGISGA